MSAENPEPQASRATSVAAPAGSASQRGAAALAVLFYALLVDVTIETLWSGSRVRWWVLGVVLGYTAVSVAIWRGLPAWWNRIGWTGRAAASVFVGLGLLALTAWIPGGLEQGIRLAGLSTPMLLGLVAALSTALAAWILIRSPRVPLAGKWIVGALSLYALVAFALGAIQQVPYAVLLNGGGFWARLPRALQGPFLAGLVVLPLAVVVCVLDRVLRTPLARQQPWGLHQVTALVLVLAMSAAGLQVPYAPRSAAGSGARAGREALAACGGDCGHASAATILAPFERASTDIKRVATSNRDGTTLTGPQARERLDYLFDAMETARSQIPRETFDPKAVVDKVGTDTTTLFAWVQENTALVPYRGVLRGPIGVLMDRVGNSLDRSLLLAELLRRAGQRVRFAHATLSDAQARVLAATIRGVPPPTTASTDDAAALGRFVEDYARRFQLDPGAAEEAAASLLRQSAQAFAAASDRITQQAKFIEKALGDLVPRDARPDPGLLESLRDHWWVQVAQDERWIDLDLAGPNGEFGRALTAASESVDADRLPPGLFQTVTIRVVAEQWTPSGVQRRTALEHTLRPLDVLGKSIMLRHTPMSWPEDLDLSKESHPQERLMSLAKEESEWLPELTLGDETIRQSSVLDDGGINTRPGSRRGSGSPLGGGLGGLFGGLTGAGGEPAQKNSVLSAEWVEFDIVVPDRPARTIRRDVFDMIGPAARRARDWSSAGDIASRRLERGLALLAETEALALGGRVPPEYVADTNAAWILEQRSRLLALFSATGSRAIRLAMNDLASAPARPNALMVFALLRGSLGSALGPAFLAEPNVFLQTNGVRLGNDAQLVRYREFDIVHNAIGILPRPGVNPFLARLEHGVADTNAEALAVSACCGPGVPSVINAAEELAASADRIPAWFVVRRPADLPGYSASLSGDVRARLELEVAEGSVLLLGDRGGTTSARPPTSYWRVDSRTGQTVGVGARGTGQAAAEKTLIVAKVATAYLCFVEVANEMSPEEVHSAKLKFCWVMAGFTATSIALPAILFHGWAQVAVGITLWLAELGVEHL